MDGSRPPVFDRAASLFPTPSRSVASFANGQYTERFTSGTGAVVRVTVEVFAAELVRAMELITILHHCCHFRGFVYQHARFGLDKKTIEVAVRPREGSAAVCSGCQKPAPGYDLEPTEKL